jgi:hypothetical protein
MDRETIGCAVPGRLKETPYDTRDGHRRIEWHGLALREKEDKLPTTHRTAPSTANRPHHLQLTDRTLDLGLLTVPYSPYAAQSGGAGQGACWGLTYTG